VLAVLAAAGSVQSAAAYAAPDARVGAFYFDGWASPLSNFHFAGLLDGPFTGREPLYGWRDNTLDAMRTQLAWAHQDGIRFFLFDWYYSPPEPLNSAHDNYLRLRDHDGVDFALMYVNQDGFVIPPDYWSYIANYWAARDFRRPDYVRVNGKPLLVIIDERGFTLQMGGAASVNHAIAVLQKAARRHGLPGVFVVGGKYFNWNTLFYDCFPSRCNDTDPAFVKEHYDAITQYAYPDAIEPQDGPRPYDAFTEAAERFWAAVAARSPFRYIPSIMAGWDPRPIAQALGPDNSGYPWLFGHLFWTRGSPTQVAGAVRDGISWAKSHSQLRVGPESSPLVVIEAWNEISEGSWILPTIGDGYAYGEAIAEMLGLPWLTAHARQINVRHVRRVVHGKLNVPDGWTPCALAELELERQSGMNWSLVGPTVTKPDGSFVARVTAGGRYRLTASATSACQQTCEAATSRTLTLR
jgi:hypothetical protein